MSTPTIRAVLSGVAIATAELSGLSILRVMPDGRALLNLAFSQPAAALLRQTFLS